jgi:hypothetical protein
VAWMNRWARASHGTPLSPLTIAGQGQISHTSLDQNLRRLLVAYVSNPPAIWGLLFVTDRRGRRFTLFSPDPEYTVMLAAGLAAGPLDVDWATHLTKFRVHISGWRL